MSAYAERRSIMDKEFMLPLSIEEFAAYLDGNLSEDEMNRIDALVSTNPEMEELVDIADEVDEDVQIYMQDEFAFEADVTALEDSDFDIPNLDEDITPSTVGDISEYRDVACTANETTDTPEISSLNSDDEIMEEMHEKNDLQTYQDEGSVNAFNEHDDGNNTHETSDFPTDDDFFEKQVLDNECTENLYQ